MMQNTGDRLKSRWRRAAPVGLAVALSGPLLGATPAHAQADDAHVVEVKMLDGKLAEIKLIRRADGKVLGLAHPYGQLVRSVASLPAQQMSVADFAQLVAATPPADDASSGDYTTGASIGYNPASSSGGIAPGAPGGECFNFTTPEPANPTLDTTFQTSEAISSFSQSTHVSSSASASYDAFTASNDFSYSDNYQSSSNSGSAYFSAAALYELSNTVDTTGNPADVDSTVSLTDFGKQQANAGTFPQSCGSTFMAIVYGGMLVTGELNWSSSSSEQSQKFTETFSGSDVGLASLSTTVSEATSVSHSAFSCGFGLQIEGGGSYASNIMSDLLNNASSLESCCTGTSSACDTWAAAMDGSISSNVADFTNDQPSWGSGPDLGSWALFPEGVADVPSIPSEPTLDPVSTLNITGLDSSNTLGDNADKLQYQLTLINQVKTLSNRSDYLNNAVAQDGYDPTNFLTLTNTLTALHQRYIGDVGTNGDQEGTLLYQLNQCLTNLDCDDLPSSSTSAYDFYSNSSDFLFQQNAIALQYQGIHTSEHNNTWPQDVVYIDQLPSFEGHSNLEPIGNQAAFVDFVHAPFYTQNGKKTDSRVDILPLNQNSDLSEIYSNNADEGVYLADTSKDDEKPGLYYGIEDNNVGDGTNDGPMVWTAKTNCSPSISEPCGIGYQIKQGHSNYPKGFSGTQIPDFFAPSGGTASPLLNSGRAVQLSRGGSRLRLSGDFPLSKTIDLRSASMSVDLLLLERGPGGAGGNGELVADANGKTVTPIMLTPRAGARPRRAVFETPRGAEPRLRVTVKLSDGHHGWSRKHRGWSKRQHGMPDDGPVAEVSARLLDDGQIVPPSACAEDGATVELVTRIVVGNDTDGAPLTLITRHPWQCRTRFDGTLALRAQPADTQP